MPGRPYTAVSTIFNTQIQPPPTSVALLDAAFAQVLTDYNDSAIGYNNYAVDTGIANAYVLTLTSAPSAYITGMTISFRVLNINLTGGCTINVNSLGNVALTDIAGNAPSTGMLHQGTVYIAVYDGAQFRIINLDTLMVDFGTNPTQTQSCGGYRTIILRTRSITSTFALTLTNLRAGTQVFWRHDSTFGPGAQGITCVAGHAGGTDYIVEAMQSYGATVGTPNGQVVYTLSGGGIQLSPAGPIIFQGTTFLLGGAYYLDFQV